MAIKNKSQRPRGRPIIHGRETKAARAQRREVRALIRALRGGVTFWRPLNPGRLMTSGRDTLIKPEEIAEVALFLASSASSSITGTSIDAFGLSNPIFRSMP